jgi:hypothetical protein
MQGQGMVIMLYRQGQPYGCPLFTEPSESPCLLEAYPMEIDFLFRHHIQVYPCVLRRP